MLKQRFRLLLLPPSYSLEIQARIPAALSALHNFILEHEPNDNEPVADEDSANLAGHDFEPELGHAQPADLEEGAMTMRRDAIAADMWQDYQRVLQERELGDDEVNDDGDGDGDCGDGDDDGGDDDDML